MSLEDAIRKMNQNAVRRRSFITGESDFVVVENPKAVDKYDEFARLHEKYSNSISVEKPQAPPLNGDLPGLIRGFLSGAQPSNANTDASRFE